MQQEFGPNSALIERFLQRISTMTPAEFGAVVSAWRDTLRRTDQWYAAEDAVGDAISHTRRNDEQWRLQDRIYGVFRGMPWYTERLPHIPVASSEPAAQYLTTTATFALLVADEISPAEFSTLYAPFAEIVPLSEIGVSALRAPADDRSLRGDSSRSAKR